MRESRSFFLPLELRAGGGDGRTVGGLVVPYNTPTEIRDKSGAYTETFRPGAFAKTIAERGTKVKLLASHSQSTLPIGKATSLVDRSDGLHGEFYVSRTQAGDDALELVRDGALDAFSVGFEPVKDEWSRDRVTVDRVEARLWEVSLVAIPAYETALVSSLRSDGGTEDESESEEEVEVEPEVEETEDDDPDGRARRLDYFQRVTAGFTAHISRLERDN